MTTTLNQQKTDLYKERPIFFKAGSKPELVDLPEASFLVVDGAGSPDDAAFQDAIGALYSIAYTLKFAGKKQGCDFKVPTFEGAWWWQKDGVALPKEQWRWQLRMMVPDFVDAAAVQSALAELAAKGKAHETPVELERLREGKCVQVMHIGPYDAEPASIEKMAAYMKTQGFEANGPHIEVYLGDPRRSKPEALKTLLRQPVRRSGKCNLGAAFHSAEKVMGLA